MTSRQVARRGQSLWATQYTWQWSTGPAYGLVRLRVGRQMRHYTAHAGDAFDKVSDDDAETGARASREMVAGAAGSTVSRRGGDATLNRNRFPVKLLPDGRAMLNVGCGTRMDWGWNNLD